MKGLFKTDRLFVVKWLTLLWGLMFSAAIFANPQVRIYNDAIHLSPTVSAEKNENAGSGAGESGGQSAAAQNTDNAGQSAASEMQNAAPKLPIDQQIKRIDAEILLLKAELARKNGIPAHVQAYLDSLESVDKALITPQMQSRMDALKQYLQQSLSPTQALANSPPFTFDDQSVAVLLPLTGDYGDIGLAIKKGLEENLPNSHLKFYDTEIFDSMLELWQLVKLSQPSFVIGPLRPGKAKVLNDLDIQVPTLMLNQVEHPKPYVRCLSLNRDGYVPVLIKQLVTHQFKGLSILVDDSEASQDLLVAFQKDWEAYELAHPDSTKNFRIHIQQIDQSMDQAVGSLVNADQSMVRKRWLQKVVQHKLHFDERSRQDLDAVVSFVSARQAIQVSPLLNFYHLGRVQYYWLPSELPSVKDFHKSLSSWRNTYALLPRYFANQVRQYKKDAPDSNQQVGIFYAFGSLAAKTLLSISDMNVRSLSSSLGDVSLDEYRTPVILPEEFWLNKGSFSVVQVP